MDPPRWDLTDSYPHASQPLQCSVHHVRHLESQRERTDLVE
jgi:hypothetical protein